MAITNVNDLAAYRSVINAYGLTNVFFDSEAERGLGRRGLFGNHSRRPLTEASPAR
jgi:hypothetical protein